jgi:hypothetical protein
MKTKKNTAVTFEILNEMSEYLFQHQNQVPFSEIKIKVADYLVKKGDKKFLEIYNETQITKNYIKALDTFNI